ncbi:MAG: hypothetical protein GY833_23025 [Aestuariibacter sp.]|nr:hypothetical protein [Aestuariibacter sp.]|tara:strand:- start:178819 stop:179214 length:396 start_codon:yes stop_codon:yes gene_type:complete
MSQDLTTLARQWVAQNVVLAEHCDIEYDDVEHALVKLLQEATKPKEPKKVFIIQHSIKDPDGSFRVLRNDVYNTMEQVRAVLAESHRAHNTDDMQNAGYYAKYVNSSRDLHIAKDGFCVEFLKICEEEIKY